MDEIIYVIFKVQFDFALEVWFSIFSVSKGNNSINKQYRLSEVRFLCPAFSCYIKFGLSFMKPF